MDEIKKHYLKEAKELKDSKQSTMRDEIIRKKEVDKIIELMNITLKKNNDPKILEIGCGNGYATKEILEKTNIKQMTSIDFCEDLIDVAKNRNLKDANFKIGNVLDLDFEDSSFDIIFTERCVINLLTWEDQQKALNEIRRVLKKDGIYLMIEAFSDARSNMNQARDTVGLEPINVPIHNVEFEKKKFLKFIEGKFDNLTGKDEFNNFSTNFLSSYYYGSRVLYPSIIEGKKDMIYNNKFIEFFQFLPEYGNYAVVQLFVLKKQFE